MKKFETNNFKFLTFDKNNKEHIEAIYLIQEDPLFRNYFGNMLDYFEDADLGQLDLTGNYMTYLDDKIVGFITLYDYFNYANLDYGLLSKYRGMRLEKDSIAVSMLREFSDEIFQKRIGLEYFKAYINNSNVRSIETAKRAGFVFFGKDICDSSEYRKYPKL